MGLVWIVRLLFVMHGCMDVLCIGGVMEFGVLVLVHMKLRRSEQTGSKNACCLFYMLVLASLLHNISRAFVMVSPSP